MVWRRCVRERESSEREGGTKGRTMERVKDTKQEQEGSG